MITRETELFAPLAAYFQGLGFDVAGEVKGCDLVARKDDELVIVEQKLRLNLELILQAVDRLDLDAHVYIAVPVQGSRLYPSGWKRIRKLLCRLDIGILLVRELQSGTRIDVALEPGAAMPRRNKRRRSGLLKEMEQRYCRNNKGGSNRRRIMTAYREKALMVLWLLSKQKTSSPAQLVRIGAPANTGAILYANYYNWFTHTGPGAYTVSDDGREALKEYATIIETLKNA